MKNICIISMIMCYLLSCELPLEYGIDDVSISQIDILDNGCRYKYTVSFTDESPDKNEDSGHIYRGYLIRRTDDGDSFIVNGPPDTLSSTPSKPYYGEVELELTIDSSNITTSDIILIRVERKNAYAGYSDELDANEIPSFPSSCYQFAISLNVDGNYIDEGECAFINTIPEMPQFQASIATGNVTGNVDWRLEIDYTRSGRNDTTTFYEITNVNAQSVWGINSNIPSGDIRGGQAVINCYSYDLDATSYFSFGIRGTNPDPTTIINYIDAIPNALWYFKYVAKHESGPYTTHGRYYNQFNEAPLTQNDADCTNPNDIKYTPNSDGAGGFGLYQLTFFYNRPPNEQELWDWKENVNSGTGYLLTKQSEATSTFETDKYWAGQYWLQDTSYTPPIFGPPDVIEGDNNNVTLSYRSDKEHKHAIAMKRYNGLGIEGINYCSWNYNFNEWIIHRFASWYDSNGVLHTNYYVNDVCSGY